MIYSAGLRYLGLHARKFMGGPAPSSISLRFITLHRLKDITVVPRFFQNSILSDRFV